jgi:PST family polysaccharide transporter
MVLLALSQILIGFIGLVIALTTFNVKISFPGLVNIKSYLIDGWNIFLSTVSINIYTTSNTFILGLFASDIIVGYFVAADKIRLAFQGIVSVISQTIFPHVNNLLKNSFKDFSLFIKRILNYGVLLGLILSLVLFLNADGIVKLILGDEFNESVLILKILSPLPFLILLSNIFGFQIMIPLGFDKPFNKTLFFAALIHIIFLFLLIPEYLAIGTSIAMLITETFVSISMIIFILRKTKIFDK